MCVLAELTVAPLRLTVTDCIDPGPVIFPHTTLQTVKVQLMPAVDV